MGKTLFDTYNAILSDISASGRYNNCCLPGIRRRSLFQDVEGYNPRIDSTNASQVAIRALLKSVCKKYTGEESSPEQVRDQNALNCFLVANERCRSTNHRLKSPNLVSGDGSFRDLNLVTIIGEARRFIEDTLSYDSCGCRTVDIPTWDIASSLRSGPGSSNGVDGTTFIDKHLTGPLTMTDPMLYDVYLSCLKHPISKHDKEGRLHPASDLAYECEVYRHSVYGNHLVPGSKLIYVPKSHKTSRTIASEPSLNMMFQLATHEQLSFFLSRRGIHIPTQQERNRDLARLGSIDGSYFTMDLTSASDSISIELIRLLFPQQWFDWLMFIRSPSVTLPNGETVELHMISSMGNGYTFALETLVFLAITYATYYVEGRKLRFPTSHENGEIGVYGDDIVAPNDAFMYEQLCYVLEQLGFIPNREKSYAEGVFRESCGGDYTLGHDVRGVYCDRLDTPQDVMSFLNRLVSWGGTHGIPFPCTAAYLLQDLTVPLVPQWDDDTAGLKVPYALLAHYAYLHRVRQHYPPRRAHRFIGHPVDHLTPLYVRYEPQVKRRVILDQRGQWQYRWAHTHATLLAALEGCLRGRCVSIRDNETTYKLSLGVAHGWDSRPGDPGWKPGICERVLHMQWDSYTPSLKYMYIPKMPRGA